MVLGGTGMIGSALRFELPRAGLSVEAPGRDVFDIATSDLSELPIHGFDYVVNAAESTAERSEAGIEDCLLVNSVFPFMLADRCADEGVKLIHLSPARVFDGKSGHYTEESAPSLVTYMAGPSGSARRQDQ